MKYVMSSYAVMVSCKMNIAGKSCMTSWMTDRALSEFGRDQRQVFPDLWARVKSVKCLSQFHQTWMIEGDHS